MQHKNACPCCRTKLINMPENINEEDEESDYDEEIRQIERDQTTEETVSIESIVDRLEQNGFTMLDIVSLYLNHFSLTNEKYTRAYINSMDNRIDDIVTELENEAKENNSVSLEEIGIN